MDSELLAVDKAKLIGFNFIQGKYYRAKITIDQVKLVTDGPFPFYNLEGNIEIPSRGVFSKYLSPASEYTFKMQLHALEGSILGYELR